MTPQRIVFNGKQQAQQQEVVLKAQVQAWEQSISILTVCFREDPGSVLYTQKKVQAAASVGMEMRVLSYSFTDSLVEVVLPAMRSYHLDSAVVGMMVQKPRRVIYERWQQDAGSSLAYDQWWQQLVDEVPVSKDVDGLTRETANKIVAGEATIFPATMKAVLTCWEQGDVWPQSDARVLIIGKSDLLGSPLAALLQARGHDVTLVGKKELAGLLDQPDQLRSFSHLVSATGQAGLITGAMVREGVVLVDAGEPNGDLDFASCYLKADFITPVPGGVGPLTVVSLLENAYQLATSVGGSI